MKNESNPAGRQFPLCLSLPLRRRRPLHGARKFLSCCYVCILLPALLGSCRKAPLPDSPVEDENPPAVVIDSVLTSIHLEAGKYAAGPLDLFIYGSGGIRPLERHFRLDSLPGELGIPTLPGEKLLVGIANSPRQFSLKALERYDAMEQLAISFEDDNPARPILAGKAMTDGQTGTIRLQPLLCQIILASVANTMDGYELLENPRIRLRDLPATVEVLREKDFRPADLIDAGTWVSLPFDIGYFPQEPGISVWCYPNDTPENVLGAPRPTLEFVCEIRGETCSFEIPLPPLPRGCKKQVALTIDGPDSYRYSFSDN